MRVIAGSAKRLILKSPRGMIIRPTLGRVKQSLFNILSSQVPGSCFLDLFAGTGSIGIEALSRGACKVTFVERDPKAINLLKANLSITGFTKQAELLGCNFSQALNLLGKKGEKFNLIFLDPPYGRNYEVITLKEIYQNNLLLPHGLIIVESSKWITLPLKLVDLELFRLEKYGDTILSFYKNKN